VAWRDAVSLYVYDEQVKVGSGERTQSTVQELLDELPEIVWP
jgi:hypothetical protein